MHATPRASNASPELRMPRMKRAPIPSMDSPWTGSGHASCVASSTQGSRCSPWGLRAFPILRNWARWSALRQLAGDVECLAVPHDIQRYTVAQQVVAANVGKELLGSLVELKAVDAENDVALTDA